MFREIYFLCEALMADLADKSSIPSVGAIVLLEALFRGENFIAEMAGETYPL